MAAKRTGLARTRKAAGLTQESLAEALHIDRTTIIRWESGKSEPQPYLRPKLARMLEISRNDLEGLLHSGAHSGTAVHDPSDERLAYVVQNPGSVDLPTVARLREQVHELDERYDSTPSTTLLARTGQCLDQVAALRPHSPSTRIRRELYVIEAESATLMGQLVWDATQRRDHFTARRYFDQAIWAAQQAREPGAEGLALLRKGFVALYGENDARAGLLLTTRAAETTKRTSQVLTGLATLHTAEAHAMQGQQRACDQALSEADRYFDRISDTDVALDLFSPTQHGRLAGSCHLFLSNAKRAQSILETTAQELQDRSKSQAIVLGNLGLAYLRQGALDEAAAILHQAVDVIEYTWGGGGLNVVFGACRELLPWRNEVVVQDVHDRVLALMSAR